MARPPPNDRGRPSGGIIVYCANKFSGKVTVWKQDLQHRTHVWLKCDGSIFQCNESLLLCALYLAPSDSSLYTKVQAAEMYQHLLAEVAEARVCGQVLLTGDCNACTAQLSDQFDRSLADFICLPSDNEFDTSAYTAPLRQLHDTDVNVFGHLLLQFCQGTQLSILNGRVFGDVPARCTSHANAGGSVIDYFIASTGICNRAQALQVHGMTPYSAHYPVVLTLDMPTSPFSASTSFSQAPTLTYDASKVEFLNAQLADSEGGLTDLGLPLLDVHGLSAEEGIQVLQDCILTAAQRTY